MNKLQLTILLTLYSLAAMIDLSTSSRYATVFIYGAVAIVATLESEEKL